MSIETSHSPANQKPHAPPVRLLFLSEGDPDAVSTHSGCTSALLSALHELGIVHARGSVFGWLDPAKSPNALLRAARKLDAFSRLRLERRYAWSPLAIRRNSARAGRIAQANPGFNACLMYGTGYVPNLRVPTYCTFDATTAQVLRAGLWDTEVVNARAARHWVGHQHRIFERCEAIFPWSEWAGRSVLEDYGIDSGKVLACGGGPNHLDEPLPHGPYDRKTILFVGVDFDYKGGPLIVDAFHRLRRNVPDARLVIIGCSPPLSEPGIEVVGRIRKDLPGGMEKLLRYYSEASVFCLMSTFEAFGVAVLEAQNCAVPCVAPDRFAFPETIEEGVTGRLVPEYDAGQLSQILEELITNPSKLEAMGRAAHIRVQDRFRWAHAACRMRERIQADLARIAANAEERS